MGEKVEKRKETTVKRRQKTVDKRERKEKKESDFLFHSYFWIVKPFVE